MSKVKVIHDQTSCGQNVEATASRRVLTIVVIEYSDECDEC